MVLILEQVLHAKLNSVTLAKLNVPVLKRSFPVVFSLVLDVPFNSWNLRITHRECTIAFLPRERLKGRRYFVPNTIW